MISLSRRPVLTLFWLVIFLVSVGSQPAQAFQPAPGSAAAVVLEQPQVGSFPQITVNLDVRDDQGSFVTGLRPEQVVILEDNLPLPPGELVELNSGAQFVFAINPAHAFAIRDGQGFSRYDLISAAFREWASTQNETVNDDLSLLVTGGPEVVHLNRISDWLASLDSYQADLRSALPSLEVLDHALQIAADPTSRPGMGRAVLFITPPPEGDFTAGLQSVAAQAKQQGVQIFVWLVSSPDLFTSVGATQLQELANQTGGSYFAYSGTEDIPNIEGYIAPLRSTYSLSYDSHIISGGAHQLVVEVHGDLPGAAAVASPAVSFELDIQPPKAVFVSPPAQIVRASPADNRDKDPQILPEKEALEILIEFPDGHPRQIITSTLYVDRAIAAVNSRPPFEQFTWDLSGYVAGGSHLIRVEVVDNLGLVGTTFEVPVQVDVQYPKQTMLRVISRQGPLVAGISILLAGSIAALALILGGRLKPRRIGIALKPGKRRWIWRRRKRADRLAQTLEGEVILPAKLDEQPAPRRFPHWVSHFNWPYHQSAPKVIAYLTPFISVDNDQLSTPIPLHLEEITLGRDSQHAALILDDPSIDALHARMHREQESFRLRDAGSIAGTWVNFTPVSQQGVVLEHGDMVHIGRIGFRYTLRQPGRIRKPAIIPEEIRS